MSSKAARLTIYAALVILGVASLTSPLDLHPGIRVPLIVLGTLSGLLLAELGIAAYVTKKRGAFSVGGILILTLLVYNGVLPNPAYSILFFVFFAVILGEAGFAFRDLRRLRKARKAAS